MLKLAICGRAKKTLIRANNVAVKPQLNCSGKMLLSGYYICQNLSFLSPTMPGFSKLV